MGDYRLFYTIDPDKMRIYILERQNRKDTYKKR
jgi:mRNA-degrading endonuclease RelE of RelBE toxin-antitoxin system